MDGVRFARTASLYSNAGFPDSVQGIRDPSEQPYGVRAAIGNVVTFEFTDRAGRAGRLQFPLPKAMTRFEVDPRANAPVPPNGPALYALDADRERPQRRVHVPRRIVAVAYLAAGAAAGADVGAPG
jgi:hypothetical protein